MIPAYINHVFIVILFAVLATTIYPSLSLKLISMGLLLYYFFLIYTNDLKEPLIFLAALALLFGYMCMRIFNRT